MRSFYPPSLHQCSVLVVFKASQSYTERREVEKKDVVAPGIQFGTSRTEGRALANCAFLALALKNYSYKTRMAAHGVKMGGVTRLK